MVFMNTVPRSLVALHRGLLVVASAGMLAGCFETTGASFTNPFATPALDPQAPHVAAQAGRGARGPTVPDSPSTADYLTADKAKSACWMQAETDKKAPKDLEKRGKWVEKCAAAKLRDQATQWASSNSQPAPAPAPAAGPLSFPGNLFGTPTSAPAEPRSNPSATDVQQKGM
ncbi:MAG: hypothetical protein JO134_06035 [Xanthobacteraceae bacterium]|nr:hypothetical protein [Xanthobacteraceae bacterium]